MKKNLTYGQYLGLEKILNAQKIQSDPPQHDELLFIIIHQSYELWFKQILHEVKFAQTLLQQADYWQAVKTLNRILKILKTLVGKVDILETMTPTDFLNFREYLSTSSGFQSLQFRCFEATFGLHHLDYFVKDYGYHRDELATLKDFMDADTLWESFIKGVQTINTDIPTPKRRKRNGLIFDSCILTQSALIDLYKNNPQVSFICDFLLDLDEGLQEWRYRHVKMVERTIGNKHGTGGSSGVDYLRSTLHSRTFPDLWEIRSML